MTAPQVDDGPCVMYIGEGGAGNYVKMVHNGIEYGDMQVRGIWIWMLGSRSRVVLRVLLVLSSRSSLSLDIPAVPFHPFVLFPCYICYVQIIHVTDIYPCD